MRNTISLMLILAALSSFSQRISFDDPDLTFSFKKPKNWEVFDDGYVVKVSPSATDSADVFFTITYFEDPISPDMIPETSLVQADAVTDFQELKIDGQTAKLVEKSTKDSYRKSYTFMKYGQRFEIETLAPNRKQDLILRKIIRSVRISK